MKNQKLFKGFVMLLLIICFSSCKKNSLTNDETKACFTYTPTNPQAGDTVVFTSCSENASLLYWYFSDGGYGDDPITKHVFATPGTYVATLEATGVSGIDSATKNITVTGLTVADVLGLYAGGEQCSQGTDTYTITVAQGTGGVYSVKLSNIYNASFEATGTLTGSSFTVPTQNVGGNVVIYGSGSFSGNSISFTYTISDGTVTNTCVFTGTK